MSIHGEENPKFTAMFYLGLFGLFIIFCLYREAGRKPNVFMILIRKRGREARGSAFTLPYGLLVNFTLQGASPEHKAMLLFPFFLS